MLMLPPQPGRGCLPHQSDHCQNHAQWHRPKLHLPDEECSDRAGSRVEPAGLLRVRRDLQPLQTRAHGSMSIASRASRKAPSFGVSVFPGTRLKLGTESKQTPGFSRHPFSAGRELGALFQPNAKIEVLVGVGGQFSPRGQQQSWEVGGPSLWNPRAA